MRQENVNTVLGWIVNSVTATNDSNPITFEEAVRKLSTREMLDRNEQDFELEEVQLLTLHSSKGLEFPYVYIIGVEEGILPHQNSIDVGDIEEERRLAYVGITRAKNELVLTYCAERNKKDKKKNTIEPSRFLFELPKEDLDWVNSSYVERDKDEEERQKKEMLDAIFDILNKS
jgi:superfamily I DNA/RNA helicase